MTRYVLKYLEEEMYIRPVDKAVVRLDEEWADSEHIIGYRLIINEKETDIVVWYADLNEYLIEKLENLQNDYHKLMRMLPNPEYDDNKQSA